MNLLRARPIGSFHRNQIRTLIGASTLLATAWLGLVACQPAEQLGSSVTVEEIGRHIRALADDRMEGRAVGTPGIEMAARYHEDVFRKAGLEPAFDGSYRQEFPLRGSLPDPTASLEFVSPAARLSPALWDEFVVRSQREDAPPEATGEVVYCGYLIQAPERSWDDLKGADLAGKSSSSRSMSPGTARAASSTART